MSDEGVGRILNPKNMDRFGQIYKSDDDSSKWSDSSPQDSRKVHARSDVDLSSRSLHHTLGTNHNQASPGDHMHDGSTAKKIGPLEKISGGGTQATWTIPTSPTVADLVTLLAKFVSFRQV